MASSDVQRKLTAILCADVVGYSRLMGENEPATLRLLTEYRQVFADYIEKFRGRIVNAPGDSILAEFGSVVDAVEGAAEIQRELAERNAELLEDRRMLFRIGVNLGDVMVKGEELYGDGVNIAARLESLAEPGGVCISRAVYDQVKQKLKYHFEYMGEQQVKNITEPVRAYQVLTKPGDAAHRVVRANTGATTITRRTWAIASMILLLAATGGFWVWQTSQKTTVHEAAIPPNSIAVLAFENLSGDPEQEYFSDAISENLLTDFSRYKELIVIARNSSFSYKGKATDAKQIGRELGARHVLEGSVQRSGKQLRIHVQLIDAETGKHLWAQRYDRKMADVFQIQDEISESVLNIVYQAVMRTAEREGVKRFERDDTENLGAMVFVWKGWDLYWKGFRQNKPMSFLPEADQLVDRALKLEPDQLDALVLKGFTNVMLGLYTREKRYFRTAFKAAKRAVEVDPHSYGPHYLFGVLYTLQRKYDLALPAFDRAIELNPNAADLLMWSSSVFALAGQPKKALDYMEKAKILNPLNPFWYANRIGTVYYLNDMFDEALNALKKERRSNFRPALRFLAATYVKLGSIDEAREVAARHKKADPKFSLKAWEKSKWISSPEIMQDFVATLRSAGFPD